MDIALPLWQCHKQVQAAQIEAISERSACDGGAVLTLTGGVTVKVDASWCARHNACVGGYYVIYEDGYTSFSPRAAFEGGYTRIAQGA